MMNRRNSPGAERPALPAGIKAKLRSVRRRSVVLQILRGLMIAGIAFVVAAATAMLIDWMFLLTSSVVRYCLTYLACAVGVGAFLKYCAVPAASRMRLDTAARVVDEAAPDLEERCSTVLELSESDDPPEMRGSESLIRAVEEETEDRVPFLSNENLVPNTRVLKCLPFFAVVAGIVICFFLKAPVATEILWRRFLSPGERISMTNVTSLTGNKFVAKGDPIDILGEVTGRGAGKAVLDIQSEDGEESSVELALSSDSPQTFGHKIRAVRESFSYRIRSGDGYTDQYKITAVDAPNIAEVYMKIAPPSYSKLPIDEKTLLPRSCRALEGSELTLAIRPTKTLADMKIRIGQTDVRTLAPGEENWHVYEATLAESISFSIHMTDEFGLSNPSPPTCRILVYPDRPPRVDIVFPDEQISMPPDAVIPVEFEASDDFEITAAAMLVTTISPDGEIRSATMPIQLTAGEQSSSLRKTVDLDLSTLGLKQGSEVQYVVQVTDSKLSQSVSGQPGSPDRSNESSGRSSTSEDETEPKEGQQFAEADDSTEKSPDESTDEAQSRQSESQSAAAANSSESSGQSQSQTSKSSESASEKEKSPDESTNESQSRESQKQSVSVANSSESSSKSQSQTSESSESASEDEKSPDDSGEQGKSRESKKDDEVAMADPSENQNQRRSQRSQSASSKPSEQEKQSGSQGSQPPPNDMTRRELNVGGQNASSKSQKILVDEWAGEFEGQMREKLQIAIDQYLKEITESLTAALGLVDRLRDHIDKDRPWAEPEDDGLAKARGHLADSQKSIADLNSKSRNTPYDFIGIQIRDVGYSHVAPAEIHLASMVREPDKSIDPGKDAATARYHISTALALIAKWTEKYEEVKRREKIAETMEHVKKMYQVFIEDSFAFLTSSKPKLNPRDGRFIEASEEDAKKKKEFLEKLTQAYAELAKLIAEDPALMRRFAAMMRNQGTTIRDQLTLLAIRQEALHKEIGDWVDAGEEGRPAVKEALAEKYKNELTELWELFTNLDNNIDAWMPTGVDRSESPWSDFARLSSEVILQEQEAYQLLGNGEKEKSLEAAEQVFEKMTRIHDLAAATIVQGTSSAEQTNFLVRRVFDTERLAVRQSGWIKKMKSLDKDDYASAQEVDQSTLMMDTVNFSDRFNYELGGLQSLGKDVGDKGKELKEFVGTNIVDYQTNAIYELWNENLESARQEEGNAVIAFASAEKIFDDLLTMVEDRVASATDEPGRGDGKEPSVDEILARLLAILEMEQDASEKLGAAFWSNISLQFDWMSPDTDGKSGQARVAAMQRSMQSMIEEMNRLSLKAKGRIEEIKDEAKPDESSISDDEATKRRERDWNVLASRLKDQLNQGRDTEPPVKYRQAISDYFKTISDIDTR